MIRPTNKPRTDEADKIKAFPIWASLLLMSIGMCFLALAGLAWYFDKSIWVILLCGLIAFKAFNTPWIYNYFLRRLKGFER